MVPPLVTASRCAPRPAGERAGHPVPDDAAAAARRTRRSGSGRRACRAPPRGSSAAARRTAPPGGPAPRASSTVQSSSAHMATICWASTSSGLAGTRSDSIAPARIRSTTTAVCTRSPRNLGNSTPRRHGADLVAGAADPLQAAGDADGGRLDLDRPGRRRPCRCRARGELVATTAGSRPALRSSSISGPLLLAHRAVVGPGQHAARRRGWRPAWAISCGRRARGRTRGRRAAPARRPAASRLAPRRQPLLPDLVEPGGQPLGQPPGVGEHERGAVRRR